MPVNSTPIKILTLLLLSLSLKSQPVYKTPSGAKYHLPNCKTVKNTSEQISIARAVALGLTPCKICKPPISTSFGAAIHKAHGQGETVQCKGLTKAGARCRHMTRIANGYCFEHQPK